MSWPKYHTAILLPAHYTIIITNIIIIIADLCNFCFINLCLALVIKNKQVLVGDNVICVVKWSSANNWDNLPRCFLIFKYEIEMAITK